MDRAKLEKAIEEKCRPGHERLMQIGRDQSKATIDKLINMVALGIKKQSHCHDSRRDWAKKAEELLEEIKDGR